MADKPRRGEMSTTFRPYGARRQNMAASATNIPPLTGLSKQPLSEQWQSHARHSSLVTRHCFCSIARRRELALVVRVLVIVMALGLPAAAQAGGVEGVARAVAQVLDLVADERGDEAVGLRPR